MFVLKGRGTAYANEKPIPVRKGDLIYYGDRERHYLYMELSSGKHRSSEGELSGGSMFSVPRLLLLDNQHRMIQYAELFRGTIDGASVYPREVVKTALSCNSGSLGSAAESDIREK